jgi:hypothetical protein
LSFRREAIKLFSLAGAGLQPGAKISAVVNYGISTDNLEIFTLFGEPTTWLQSRLTGLISLLKGGYVKIMRIFKIIVSL